MKKAFLIGSILLFLLGCILLYQNIAYNDKKLHIVICDVGQGDAIFIRTPKGSDILIDAGPDDSVLACLGKHMPLWDRTIELAILTHPHADHFTGLFSILKTYKIKVFASEDLINKTIDFKTLTEEVKKKNIPVQYVSAGERFIFNSNLILKIVGPTQEFLTQVSPNGEIGGSDEQASLEIDLSYGKFNLLLTGDSQALELQDALGFINWKINVLQIPHHGSKTGLTQEILKDLNPKLAVISVGANNKYGLPNPFTLNLLKQARIKILRTDESGDIEIISDGNKFWQN